jgi:hypothetical protein
MPHTCAAQFRVLSEAAEFRNMPQMQNSTSENGWNDCLDWNLPGATHHPGALDWFLNEGATSDQPQFLTHTQSPTADAANGLPQSNSERMTHLPFCGLQPWYSSGVQDFLSLSPTATARPQLSGSEFDSYTSTSLGEESHLTGQSYSSLAWSHNVSRQISSVSDRALAPRPSNGPTVDLTQELDNTSSHSSEDKEVRRNATGVDVHKRRKMAHSIVEKNYRSRINDGMTELRDCVPSTARGGHSLDSKRRGSQQGADDAAPDHLFGKVATLSNAVQYVKSLELENEGLHGRLRVMKRRNYTLQQIALSKTDTRAPVTSIKLETDQEDIEAHRHGSKKEQASKKRRKSPLDPARFDGLDSRRMKFV